MVANREDYSRVKHIDEPLPHIPPCGSSTVTIFENFEFVTWHAPCTPHERVPGFGRAMQEELERWRGVGPSAGGREQILICI
jgi:hypothetical protein